ncbi:hypothetical protein YC2023_030375 [Brassica napus]
MAVVQILRQIWICGELCLFPLPPLCLIFSIWVGWFAWLKTLRVPQTVELRGVCEEASSRSCQPRLAFSVAARSIACSGS